MSEILKNIKQHKIETPNGFEEFYGVNKIERDWYIHIILSDQTEFRASPKHPFVLPNDELILAHEALPGTKLKGKFGSVEVIYNEVVDEPIELYDIVDSGKDNLYYTNGVVSHNCEFVGSQNTLISATKLKEMPFIDPISTNGQLDVYRNPEPDHIYTITVDVSHGEGLDFSTFSVIDCGQFPYRVVAKYRSSSISPLEYPTVIQNVAKTYNNAWVLVEINDIGQQVATILHEDLEYDHLLYVTTRGRAGQGLGTGFGAGQLQFGIKTSKKVKQIGCANLKNLIEADRLIVEDFDTICEMTSFIAKGYSYEAEPGHHDDLMMNLVLFAWCTTEPYFKDVTNTDTHKKMVLEKLRREELRQKESEEREMEHLVPFGIISTPDPDADKYRIAREGSDSWIWAGDDDW